MSPYTPPKTPDKIPVVDLVASFSGDPKDRAAIAWEIHKASRETGFFYVANHGIDQTLVDRAFVESARFLELPVERKTAVGLDNWPCLRGHEAMRAQVLDAGSPADLKESFYVGRELGDMVKRRTNDVYHSNMHRILNKAAGRDRYSLALFFSPDYFTQIE